MKTYRLAIVLMLSAATLFGQEAQPKVADSELPAPFGIRMGASKSELKITKEVAPFLYELASVPKPHSAFETYIAQVTPKSGVCFVKAIGADINTSAYGNELRSEVDKLRDQIDSVYGKSKLLDQLRYGSIWHEPREWMMGLREKERIYAAHWSSSEGLVMKLGIKEIYLAAQALASDRGYVALEYYFDNYSHCQDEVKTAQKSVF